MEKLDVKDRKILYELDIDSRQSFSKLGKKVGLHKDVVALRVKKLIRDKIIYNFYTYVDLSKLGYNFLRFYFKLQFISPEIREKIIQELVNNKFSTFVNSAEGEVELSAYFAVKNIYEFAQIWEKFYSQYGQYFAHVWFSIWYHECMYCYSFLLENDQNKRSDKNTTTFGQGTKVDIDELDFQILKILSSNSRVPSLDLAKKLNVTANTIKRRISDLQKKGVIKGYKIDIAFDKLDYKFYRLDVYLKNQSIRYKINDYITDNPLIRSRYISLGDAADLEYEIIIKSIDQIHQLMEDVITKFPECIKNYRYYTSLKRYKNVYVTDL
jgi:Lrp/AsnC family transcriptional regulator, leucine-responsive regulatory protein